MSDEDADGGSNARQLGTAENLGIVHVQAGANPTCSHGLPQAIQKRIEPLVRGKLSVREETAGIIENGIQKDLHAPATRALDVGPEQHVGLPDLITPLCFELLVRRCRQQLTGGQTALFEKAIQSGGGNRGGAGAGHQRQFAQQSHTGAMWVLAFQAFDQLRQLWCNDTRLPAIAALFGSQGGKAPATIAQRPIEQGVDRKRSALGVGDLILTSGDLFGPAREFTARQHLQNQRSDESIAKQGDFFGPRVHDLLSTSVTQSPRTLLPRQTLCVGGSGTGGSRQEVDATT